MERVLYYVAVIAVMLLIVSALPIGIMYGPPGAGGAIILALFMGMFASWLKENIK